MKASCPKSPTGAHYWREIDGKAYCQYPGCKAASSNIFTKSLEVERGESRWGILWPLVRIFFRIKRAWHGVGAPPKHNLGNGCYQYKKIKGQP